MQIDDLNGARNRIARQGNMSSITFTGSQTYLVVLDGEIVTLLTFPVCDLHKVSAHQRLADVDKVTSLVLVRLGYNVNFEALHDSEKLGADVVCLRKGTGREIVVPGPIAVVKICMMIFSSVTGSTRSEQLRTVLILVIDIKESEVVPVRYSE